MEPDPPSDRDSAETARYHFMEGSGLLSVVFTIKHVDMLSPHCFTPIDIHEATTKCGREI